MKRNAAIKEQLGFTLIELSIVLVIIGLIVGGILVGQDMIRASEVRATVAQVEKYNSAINTFRSKYNFIPGDIPQAVAASYGLFQLTNTTITGQGDGNGLLEGGGTGVTSYIGETAVFWRHLSDAQLVDGSYGITGNSAITAATGLPGGAVNAGTMFNSLPPTRMGKGTYFVVFAPTTSTSTLTIGGQNFYELLPVLSISTAGAYGMNTSGINPIEASNIDGKLDDGAPNTGAVMARGIDDVNTMPTVATAAATATCTIGTGVTSDTYNRSLISGGTDNSCAVRMRFN